MGCSGSKGKRFPKAKGKHSKWFFIHRNRGTLRNYTQAGTKRKRAKR